MDEEFDCIIVGGGVAGLAAAMVLARKKSRFLLVERGEFCGAKNVSGGILWGTDLARLVPDYWDQQDGYERFVNHRRLTFLDEQSAMSIDFKSSHFDQPPYNGVAVLRARFDRWLATKVQETIDANGMSETSFLATNVLVDELLTDGDRVLGIRADEECFRANCVIVAEGINNLLTRQIGLQAAYVPADHVAVGVKEVVHLEQSVLEDRFQLKGPSGLANEFLGFANRGVEGGGFLYTNRDSLSIGLVMGMEGLRSSGQKPYDMLNAFKSHPVVTDMIRGGELVEYSAHVVSTGDIRAMPRELYGDGVLIVGEAAHLLMNAGRAIQGMDFAMRSGILAAETLLDAKQKDDFSKRALRDYRDRLEASFVMKDLRKFQDAVRLLHSPAMYNAVPNLLCDFGRQFFTVDNHPTQKARQLLKGCVKKHSSYGELARLAFRAYRSL